MRNLLARLARRITARGLRRTARRQAMSSFSGPAEDEGEVRRMLSDLIAELTTAWRGDAERHHADRAFLAAEQDVARAIEQAAGSAEAARQAAPSPGDLAGEVSASRAQAAHRQAQDDRSRTQHRRELANLAVADAQRASLNRLMTQAQQGLRPVNAYIAAFNGARSRQRRSGLDPLPAGTDHRLVRAAVAAIDLTVEGVQ